MHNLSFRELDTEVLVVGGGAAAALAAIKAHDAGAKVLLVSKSGFPAGASSMARAGFQAALGHSDPRDNPEVHYQDTLKAGAGLNNPKLVRIMAEGIIEIVAELDRWGTDLIKKGDKFDQRHRVGCTYPRHLHHYDTTGKVLMRSLSAQVRAREIPVFGSTMVIDVLKDDEGISGAVVLDYKELELIKINARAIVLATGGAGQVFEVTDNPTALTGDGYALAFKLGVELIDMEMIDFQLLVCAPERLKSYPPNSSAWIAAGARLYNGCGERFMKKHQPETLEKSSRALINRAVGIELFNGRGTKNGGVYLDLSDIPAWDIPRLGPSIAAAFARNNIDLTYQPMELAPGAHTFLGGVLIKEDCSTSLPGLYAAGEVAGGIHGANRLGGNAITDPLVFGARAGQSAAAFSAQAKSRVREWDSGPFKRLWEREKGLDYQEVRRRIQAIMSAKVGLVRSEERLQEALVELSRVKEELLPQLAVKGNTRRELALALKGAMETENILLVGQLIATSALNRRESRGAHYRFDHPAQGGEEWLKHVACYQGQDGEIACKFIGV